MNTELLQKKLRRADQKVEILEKMIEDRSRELYLTNEQLQLANVYLQNVIQSMADALIVVNPDGKIKAVNPAALRLLGYSRGELIGKPVESVFAEESAVGPNIDELIESGFIDNVEKTYLTKDVTKIPVIFSSSVMRDDGDHVQGVVCVALDITERKEQEEKIRKLAETDSLTKIYNRRMFSHFLEIEVKKAERYSKEFPLIMFDIDHFKKVNDTYGHDVGDDVLTTTVDVIKRSIRKADIFARYGGEEFIIIQPNTVIEGAKASAEKIRTVIEQNNFDKVKKITISVGVTMFKENDTTESITKRVDDALYRAKNNGRNRVEVA